MHRKLLLKNFKFLEEADFKCVPTKWHIGYYYKNLYLTAFLIEAQPKKYLSMFFFVSSRTIEIPYKVVLGHDALLDIYDYNIGTSEDRNKLKSLENTIDNFENALEAYAKFIKEHLDEILKLAK